MEGGKRMLLSGLLQMQPDDALLYLEQNVNYLFQDPDRYSEVAEDYQSEKGGEYLMPYVWLDLNHPAVDSFEACPDPRLIEQVRQRGRVQFFIHPEMIPEYKTKGFSELLDFAGNQMVAPTASTRTVITRGLAYNFMVKTNMTRVVGLLSRKMRRSSVAHSSQIMVEMAEIKDCIPRSLAYLPESIGVVYEEEIGVIFRECQARPRVNEQRHLIPFFSLISLDRRSFDDPLLLCQIVEGGEQTPLKTFLEQILKPILGSWSYLVFKRGIHPIAHFQNLLLELDREGKPKRIVFRDLQDTIIDSQVRSEKGLHSEFARHFIDDIDHTKIQVGPDIVRDPEIARRIRYSLSYDFWLGLIFDCFIVVLSKYPSCTEERIVEATKELFRESVEGSARNLFPPEQFFIERVDPEDPRMRMVGIRGKPKYR
jgi:hypothetical protein